MRSAATPGSNGRQGVKAREPARQTQHDVSNKKASMVTRGRSLVQKQEGEEAKVGRSLEAFGDREASAAKEERRGTR